MAKCRSQVKATTIKHEAHIETCAKTSMEKLFETICVKCIFENVIQRAPAVQESH